MKQEKASIWRRGTGALTDGIILALVWFVFSSININLSQEATVIGILIGLGYQIVLTYKNKGQTIGKMIVGTRVVAEKGNLTLQKVISRYIILELIVSVLPVISEHLFSRNVSLYISLFTFITILVTMIIDKKNRGPHDLIAGTWVVKV